MFDFHFIGISNADTKFSAFIGINNKFYHLWHMVKENIVKPDKEDSTLYHSSHPLIKVFSMHRKTYRSFFIRLYENKPSNGIQVSPFKKGTGAYFSAPKGVLIPDEAALSLLPLYGEEWTFHQKVMRDPIPENTVCVLT